jgi:isopenicillin N synthase-like dioxygenase
LKFPDATVEQLAEDTLQLSREFFALPLAEKEVLKMLAYIGDLEFSSKMESL